MNEASPYDPPADEGRENGRNGVVAVDSRITIQPDSAIPYYYQLQVYIKDKIESGEWMPGEKLPSQEELCQRFNISRTVVRQTLNNLANENLIVTHKGQGSFVAPQKKILRLMQSIVGFYEDTVSRGLTVGTQVLEQVTLPADPELAANLGIAPGDPVVKLSRLRSISGELVVFANTYIPERLCPGLIEEDLREQSLYRLLADQYGLKLAQGTRQIESVNANPNLAELLGVPAGAALLQVEGIGQLADGTTIEYYKSWHRGDRARIKVHVVDMR
jgi:GntR family transcriptional regulator